MSIQDMREAVEQALTSVHLAIWRGLPFNQRDIFLMRDPMGEFNVRMSADLFRAWCSPEGI